MEIETVSQLCFMQFWQISTIISVNYINWNVYHPLSNRYICIVESTVHGRSIQSVKQNLFFGKLWQIMANFGKHFFWQTETKHIFWQTLANYGKLWQTLANYGKLWQTLFLANSKKKGIVCQSLPKFALPPPLSKHKD